MAVKSGQAFMIVIRPGPYSPFLKPQHTNDKESTGPKRGRAILETNGMATKYRDSLHAEATLSFFLHTVQQATACPGDPSKSCSATDKTLTSEPTTTKKHDHYQKACSPVDCPPIVVVTSLLYLHGDLAVRRISVNLEALRLSYTVYVVDVRGDQIPDVAKIVQVLEPYVEVGLPRPVRGHDALAEKGSRGGIAFSQTHGNPEAAT